MPSENNETVPNIHLEIRLNDSNSNNTFIALNLHQMIDAKSHKSEIVIVKSGTLQGSTPRRRHIERLRVKKKP